MIERARIKQAARQTVRQGGNQSGMIGAGILPGDTVIVVTGQKKLEDVGDILKRS